MSDTKLEKTEKATKIQQVFGELFEEVKTYQELNLDGERILADVMKARETSEADKAEDKVDGDTKLIAVLTDLLMKFRRCNNRHLRYLERIEL